MQSLCRARCGLWREHSARSQEARDRRQGESELQLDSATTERFARDLDALSTSDGKLGIAVSGGPDSLALLLMAAGARAGNVEAATVDHALRSGSREEAEMVAGLCRKLGVSHAILTTRWEQPPTTAIQERARAIRYALLEEWAVERKIDAICTAHHADDQAETLLMRLARGAGVSGLAGMRPVARIPGARLALLRPLLGWRHSELVEVCGAAGVEPVHDQSNDDEQFERVRVRRALQRMDWLDPSALARSAGHLADADEALRWSTELEWCRAVTESGHEICYRRGDAPREIARRIVGRAIGTLASEGDGADLRGRELDQILGALEAGQTRTLRGVLCTGGAEWRFTRAPARRP